MPKGRRPVLDRIMEKVRVNERTGCWEFMGARSRGYGYIKIAGQNVQAYRVTYFSRHPEADRNLLVLHRCDNPPCVNPDHLYLGTHKDNNRDMIQRRGHWMSHLPERVPRGTNHWSTRLTEEDVRTIHDTRGVPHHLIAEKYGTCRETVRRIINEKSWRHLWQRPQS